MITLQQRDQTILILRSCSNHSQSEVPVECGLSVAPLPPDRYTGYATTWTRTTPEPAPDTDRLNGGVIVVSPLNYPCVVTTVRRDAHTVWMRFIGALDMNARPALGAAVTRLSELDPHTVILDFAGVTFAGAALSRFLVEMHEVLLSASIIVHHASPNTRLVMILTATDHLVVHEQPRSWDRLWLAP